MGIWNIPVRLESGDSMSKDPMSVEPAQTAETGSLHFVSEYAQVAAIGLGALYTVGLLIVNADLARYGLLSTGLARPEYILTGALWAYLMLSSLSCYWLVADHSTHNLEPTLFLV